VLLMVWMVWMVLMVLVLPMLLILLLLKMKGVLTLQPSIKNLMLLQALLMVRPI
jgi:hypothetical protein